MSKAFLMVNYQLSEAIKEIQDKIDDNDLYVEENAPTGFSYGKETEPHVTLAVLRGNVKLDNVKPLLCPLENYKVKLINLSIFNDKHNDERFDVLKCDVECDALYSTNDAISRKFSVNKRHDGEFNPHITVAYLKKGKGKEYEQKLAEQFPESVTLEPIHFIFRKDDNRETFPD